MKRGLIGLCWLLGAGCVEGGSADLSLGDSCNPTELGGCVKFDDTSAFADLYGYCADPGTAADDPLCEEPMHVLGVTSGEVAFAFSDDQPCVEQVLAEESDAVTERSMEEILASIRACLSQDTHEGDSTITLPTLDDKLTRDPDEGGSNADSNGGGKGSNQGVSGNSGTSSTVVR